MKYVPTKNLSQVWFRIGERKEFEDAAEKVAKEEFLKELKDEDCSSIAAYKSYLKEFTLGDLMHDIYELQDERDDEQIRAGNPDITPEQSFRRLVESYKHMINIDIHNEVIAEMR